MSKNIDDIAFIVQARLNSQRVPQKMIKPFAGTNLFGLILDKLLDSEVIPSENIIASVHEEELFNEANTIRNIRTFERSYESANNDNDIKKIYEWHNKLPHKYCILISGCNPLLSVRTIDNFVKQFVEQEEENLFAVFEKKTYYWNKEGALITPWPKDQTIMNTKAVEPVNEAAHTLYASRIDMIEDERFMGDFTAPGGIKLFKMDELEAFDIDYPWQFEVGEMLYEKFKK
jgi:CMP-N-acetylneuraminic acid synthetase|tara:strand:+ start:3498 stop:4190 length:693 start_codon:yes stop_codon:yes gene_type:complete